MKAMPVQHRPAALLLLLFTSYVGLGQTLARPGWAGSGMTLEPWYLHSVFYRLDPHTFSSIDPAAPGVGNLRGIVPRLDYIHSLGADAITLTHLGSGTSIDPALGTLDDFDDLVREASRDSLRVVVELDPELDPPARIAAGRVWLTHGAAGISNSSSAQLQELHHLAKSFSGQRILIAPEGAGAIPELLLDPALAAASAPVPAALRSAVQAVQANAARTPTLATIASAEPAAKVLATLLLATRANAQITAGQEIALSASSPLLPWGDGTDPGPQTVAAQEADPASVLNWYRRLIDLHHGNATLRSGTIDFLNHDAQQSLVWITRRGTASFANPAIVVACNLSGTPITLSLADDLRGLHLRGSFLRTILRTDTGMGGTSVTGLTLPPYGVYMGELLY